MSKLKFLFLGLIGSTAHASGGGVDFYQRAAGLLGVPEHFVPAFSAILSVPALFFLGLAFSRGVSRQISSGELAPVSRFSLSSFVEMILGLILGVAQYNCGKAYRAYLPLLCAIFFQFFLVT